MNQTDSNRATRTAKTRFRAAAAGAEKTRRIGYLAAAMPLLIAGSLESHAQGATTRPQAQLEEVVVTASRREESLQEVATSASVLSASALQNQGISNFDEIKQAVAGLHLEAHGNMSTAQVRIRGVGDSPNSGVDPSVGVLVDGVYQVRGGAAFTELMDIERVEVLRGPQGTMFGKNTTAGVIHIHTSKPDPSELSGKLQGVVGNYDSRELRGTLNLPLIDDKLALRISGFTTQRDGYSRNIYLNQDTQNGDKEGGRIKLLWNVTENLEVLWSSEILKQKGQLDQGLIEYGRDDLTSTAYRGQPWENLAAALGMTLPDVRMGRTAHNLREFEDDVERHVLTLNASLPGHRLQSITAVEEFDSYILSDRDRTIMDLASSINEPATETRSQEFILSSEQDGPLSYIVGLFYQQEELESPTQLINGPDQITLGGPARTVISTTQRDNKTQAAFTNLTYAFTDRWSAVAGVRYTEDRKQEYATLDLGTGAAALVTGDSERTFSEWTYTAKLLHHLDDNRMVYLSIDHGFKSGGFNRQDTQCLLGVTSRCLSEAQLNYDPETTDSIELGLKSEWLDNRLRLNGALFYQTYDDYQVRQSIPTEVAVRTTNAAEVESKGIELDMVAVLTEQLQVNAALAWVSTQYDNFANAPCATPTSPGCVGGRQDLSGKQLDNAPKLTFNLGVEYRSALALAGGMEWFARVDSSYRDDAYLDVTYSEKTVQKAYTLYSARLGLEPVDARWRMTLWGKNLGDKSYAVVGAEDVGGVTRLQGMPRSYGLSVDYNF